MWSFPCVDFMFEGFQKLTAFRNIIGVNITMDIQNYSPETQVHWTALEVGKEYLQSITAYRGSVFARFVFVRIDVIGECRFVVTNEPLYTFAVGDWIEEKAGGPCNLFWTLDTPIPPTSVLDNKPTSENSMSNKVYDMD